MAPEFLPLGNYNEIDNLKTREPIPNQNIIEYITTTFQKERKSEIKQNMRDLSFYNDKMHLHQSLN